MSRLFESKSLCVGFLQWYGNCQLISRKSWQTTEYISVVWSDLPGFGLNDLLFKLILSRGEEKEKKTNTGYRVREGEKKLILNNKDCMASSIVKAYCRKLNKNCMS